MNVHEPIIGLNNYQYLANTHMYFSGIFLSNSQSFALLPILLEYLKVIRISLIYNHIHIYLSQRTKLTVTPHHQTLTLVPGGQRREQNSELPRGKLSGKHSDP